MSQALLAFQSDRYKSQPAQEWNRVVVESNPLSLNNSPKTNYSSIVLLRDFLKEQ